MSEDNANSQAASDPGTNPGSTDQTAPAAETQQTSADAPQGGGEQGQDQQGVPEQYQWTTPDGLTLDPATLDAYSAAARELGLPQDQAQSIIDRVVPAMVQAQAAQTDAAVKAWESATQADPEIGGDKLAESLATAKRALSELGSPALSEFLNITGLGSHPEIIRMMAKAGRALGPDTIPPRGAGPGQGESVLDRLYPTMKKG